MIMSWYKKAQEDLNYKTIAHPEDFYTPMGDDYQLWTVMDGEFLSSEVSIGGELALDHYSLWGNKFKDTDYSFGKNAPAFRQGLNYPLNPFYLLLYIICFIIQGK